jgi:hypothetical protein
MQLTQRITFRTERSARPRRRHVARVLAARAEPKSTPTRDQARVGPPQDRATYGCGCGYVFQADVTTSVGCPHCGSELAW